MMALSFPVTISQMFPLTHGVLPGPIAALVDAAVRALLVAGVVWAGLRLLHARNVIAQKAAWGLVLAGALLMPFAVPWAATVAWVPARATLVVPALGWLRSLAPRPETATFAPQTAAPATPRLFESTPLPRAAETTALPSSPSQPGRFPAPAIANAYTPDAAGVAPTAGKRPIPPLSPMAMAWMLYSAICGVLLMRLFYGLGAALGLWLSAEPVTLASSPHLASGLHLRSSGRVSSPVTIGSGIVLPAGFDQWDTEKLRIVLAHERSHVRQGDFYLQILAGIYTALFWFSPLGWWLQRKLSDLSEAISDRAGLVEAASHASYAQILLEFAALPRRTQIGVAMARTGRISHRIERLLNENSFRQAFAGGRRRLLAALLLVPATLFAATALIRVEAAQTMQKPVSTHGPVLFESHPAQSHPESIAARPQPATSATLAQAPAPPTKPTPPPPPNGPGSTVVPAGAPSTPPPPEPPDTEPANGDSGQGQAQSETQNQDQNQDQTVTTTDTQCNANRHTHTHTSTGQRYTYSYSSNGDSYALISGEGWNQKHINFSGDWSGERHAEIDKARAMAHGDFLWFTRNGKSYVVDDPQMVAQIHAMYKPMEDLGRQQEELGRKQEALGRLQEELGRQQEQASVPAPDIAREMADLNAAVAKLQAGAAAKQQAKNANTISEEQLADLEAKIGELQEKLGALHGEVGERQGELGRKQGELGEQQGKLGEQQGRLGEEQGRLAREADHKVKSIIDESLKDGKARPVQ